MAVTEYSYQEVPVPGLSARSSLVFAIKACQDAHVAFSASLDLTSDMVEIVIGAGDNSYTAIRDCPLNCQLT